MEVQLPTLLGAQPGCHGAPLAHRPGRFPCGLSALVYQRDEYSRSDSGSDSTTFLAGAEAASARSTGSWSLSPSLPATPAGGAPARRSLTEGLALMPESPPRAPLPAPPSVPAAAPARAPELPAYAPLLSGAELRGPSGLRAHSELPSVGSGVHGSGECRPCAWFWKPTGCQNGKECRHCHLCPAGELKQRKRTKLAILRRDGAVSAGTASGDVDLASGEEPQESVLGLGGIDAAGKGTLQQPVLADEPCFVKLPPQAPTNLGLMPRQVLPSLGSALHASRRCEPCVWFWKPQGCMNGPDCGRCHLCPHGEVKSRKKEKLSMLRAGMPTAMSPGDKDLPKQLDYERVKVGDSVGGNPGAAQIAGGAAQTLFRLAQATGVLLGNGDTLEAVLAGMLENEVARHQKIQALQYLIAASRQFQGRQ